MVWAACRSNGFPYVRGRGGTARVILLGRVTSVTAPSRSLNSGHHRDRQISKPAPRGRHVSYAVLRGHPMLMQYANLIDC